MLGSFLGHSVDRTQIVDHHSDFSGFNMWCMYAVSSICVDCRKRAITSTYFELLMQIITNVLSPSSVFSVLLGYGIMWLM